MKRFLIISSSVFFLLFIAAGTFGYFYGRAHLKDIPPLVQSNLKSQGIDFAYQSVDVPSSGLSLTLQGLSISGKGLAYPVTAASARISISISFGSKPLIIGLYLDRPEVGLAERKAAPQPAPATPSSAPPGYVGALLALVQFELGVKNANLPEFGVEGITATVRANSFRLAAGKLAGIRLSHDVVVQKIAQAPWLSSMHTEGRIVLDGTKVTIDKTSLDAGPFRLSVASEVDLETKAWKAKLFLPETEVSSASQAISSRASEWLTKITGRVGVDASAEGTGFQKSDPFQLKVAKADVKADKLILTLKHPNVVGEVRIDSTAKVQVTDHRVFQFNLSTDLSSAQVRYGDTFEKAKGVALKLNAVGSGKDTAFTFDDISFSLNNLAGKGKGTFQATEEPAGDLKFAIQDTSLAGWEKFFPKYSNVKCKGTLGADIAYSGPLKEWKRAAMDINVRASDLTFPLLADWFGKSGVTADGQISIDSKTKIAVHSGAIDSLDTNTSLDLTQGSVTSGDLFSKGKGMPFTLGLQIVSQGKKALVKQGNLRMGPLVAKVSGSIENLTNPIANLKFAMDLVGVEQLKQLSPTAKKTMAERVNGNIAASGKIVGPLLDPKRPVNYDAALDLKGVAFKYQLEGSKHPIDIKNLSGTVRATRDTASIKKFVLQTPNSNLQLDASVTSFDRPDIRFLMKGDKFQIKDFYESEKPKESVGLVAVPVAKDPGGKGKAEDFRKNPWLKKTKLQGDVALKNADLGSLKADTVNAHVTYENLLLKVDPLVLKTFGGTVTTSTVWDGRKEVPVSNIALKTEGVDANQFLGNFSERGKDLVLGKLNSNFTLSMSGMTADEIKKSSKGDGSFSLNDAQLTTLKFTQKPVEELKKLPGLSGLNKNSHEERLNQINGAFKVADGKLHFSDLIVRSNLFDANTSELAVDFSMGVTGRLILQPKESLIPKNILDLIRDDSGQSPIPLKLAGNMSSPDVSVDIDSLSGRIRQNAARKVTNEVKEKLQGEIQKKLGDSLKGLFK